MTKQYADDFYEILEVLNENEDLKSRVISLMEKNPILGKSLEGDGRLDEFRNILIKLVKEEISPIEKAYGAVELRLPQSMSKYATDSRVFPSGWAERLVRIQLSRFYNQAVLEMLIEKEETQCYVPHSKHEESTTNCSKILAGNTNEIKELYDKLIRTYEHGVYDKEVKIPDHPHCTHVIKPLEE